MTLLAKWRAWLRARLIAEWTRAWAFWSVRLHLIAITLASVFAIDPTVVLDVWNGLPDDIKALLPPHFARWIPIVLGAAGVIARVFKQKEAPNVRK